MKRKPASAKPSPKARKARLVRVPEKAAVFTAAHQEKILSEVMVALAASRAARIARTDSRFNLLLNRGLEKAGVFFNAPRNPWQALATFFGFAFATIGIYALMIGSANAAAYQGPTLAPPGGNVPVTIWNRVSSLVTQTNAAIAVDGGGPAPANYVGFSIGSNTLDMGVAAGGQNLIYGVADGTKMNATDYLLLLQVAPGANRFSVNGSGNGAFAGTLAVTGTSALTGNVTVGGAAAPAEVRLRERAADGANFVSLKAQAMASDITLTLPATTGATGQALVTDGTGLLSWSAVNACNAVRKYVGLGTSGTGSQGGYSAINGVCAVWGAGASVCTVDEMLNSTKCSGVTFPVVPPTTDVWVSGGPPGFTAPANDCDGWTTAANNQYGRMWRFIAGTPKGKGLLTTCNSTLPFACCQ